MLKRSTIFMLALLFVGGAGADDHASDFAGRLAALQAESSEDGQAWLTLGNEARHGGAYDVAATALDKAAEYGASPVQVAVEKIRLGVQAGNPAEAEAELRTLFESGFNAVGFVESDEVISSLAGRPEFDAIVEEMRVVAYPCNHMDGFGDFDFWVGEWEVHGGNGQFAGTNKIEKVERGCVLLEQWTSGTGGTGTSINYLDGATGEWVQVWNAEGGTQINIRGGLTDDGMLLVGHVHYLSNGETAPFRGLWTLLEDGRVRQYFERSPDDGDTWEPWFEGFYTRTTEQEEAE